MAVIASRQLHVSIQLNFCTWEHRPSTLMIFGLRHESSNTLVTKLEPDPMGLRILL